MLEIKIYMIDLNPKQPINKIINTCKFCNIILKIKDCIYNIEKTI